jgi:hypothetical protein
VRSRVYEVRPIALFHSGTGCIRERKRVIAGTGVQHVDLDAAWQARQRSGKITLLVSRENDGGD